MKIFEVIGGYYYHGTARKNVSFAPQAIAYFARRYEDAVSHAQSDAEIDGGVPRVIEVLLDIQHPVRMAEREMQDLHLYPKLVARLRRLGHDAVADRDSDNEIAVLDPAKIRVIQIIDASHATTIAA